MITVQIKSLFLLSIIPITSGLFIILTMSYFQAEECKAFSEKYGQDWLNLNKAKCDSVFSERLGFSTLEHSFWTILLTWPIWGGAVMTVYSIKKSSGTFLRYVIVGTILGVFLISAVIQSTFHYIELVDYGAKICPINVDQLRNNCSFIMENYNRMVLEYSILTGLSIVGLASAVVYFKKTCDEIKVSRRR